jgi:hypothetical protein
MIDQLEVEEPGQVQDDGHQDDQSDEVEWRLKRKFEKNEIFLLESSFTYSNLTCLGQQTNLYFTKFIEYIFMFD